MSDLESLEKFLLNNPELDKLEGLLSQFNIFETLNIVNVEVRHSNVLAWMLNPLSNHGLGDFFQKQFLKYFVSENKETLADTISLFDIELMSYADTEIRREWGNIDILILIAEEKKKLAVAIENKMKSPEHSQQLQRYRAIVEKEFPEFVKLYIYLTPDNSIPSDENWVPFSYSTIADLTENLLTYKRDVMNDGTADFITQYDTILRRYIVGNSEVEQICREIYKKHKDALDLIFQYKPDVELEISEHLQRMIGANESLIPDYSSKSYTRFITAKLERVIEKKGEGWTKSKRMLLFEFNNYDMRLVLRLIIGPGPQDYREKLFEFCGSLKSILKLTNKLYGKKWQTVYQKEFLGKKDFENPIFEDLVEKIDSKWNDFLNSDLRQIEEHFSQNWETRP